MKRFLWGLLFGLSFVATSVYAATVLMPQGGGTGISTKPTSGQMLIGTASGTYSFIASSTLGGILVETDPIWSAASTSYVLWSAPSTTYWDTAYNWGDWKTGISSTLPINYDPLTGIIGWTNSEGYITTTPAETDPIWIAASTSYAKLSLNNVFTGINTFGVTTTFNSLTYRFPSSHAAGSLSNDGSGNLSWSAAGAGDAILAANQTFTGLNTFSATTTLATTTVEGIRVVGDRNWKFTIASSTIASMGSLTATTTVNIPVDGRAMTLTNIYCYTDSGTTTVWFTDGTNATESVSCGSTVSQDDGTIVNGSFTALEIPKVGIIMNGVGTPNTVSITGRYNYDAD